MYISSWKFHLIKDCLWFFKKVFWFLDTLRWFLTARHFIFKPSLLNSTVTEPHWVRRYWIPRACVYHECSEISTINPLTRLHFKLQPCCWLSQHRSAAQHSSPLAVCRTGFPGVFLISILYRSKRTGTCPGRHMTIVIGTCPGRHTTVTGHVSGWISDIYTAEFYCSLTSTKIRYSSETNTEMWHSFIASAQISDIASIGILFSHK